MQQILELESLLDNEISIYKEIENTLIEKKDSIIKGDVEKLKTIDEKIMEYSHSVQDILMNRQAINQTFGEDSNSLSSLIKRINDVEVAKRIERKRKTINETAKNIETLNYTIVELIHHAMKLVEGSVHAISEALNPNASKSQGYTIAGKVQKGGSLTSYRSSIVKEA